MLIKKLAISAAAGAIMLASASGAFAYYNGAFGGHYTSNYTKTVTVTKAEVTNTADVHNTVVTVSNTGLNFTGANGGTNNANTTSSGSADDGSHFTGGANGGAQYQGGAANQVTTGNAGASSTVANVVNTTLIHQ